MEMERQQHSRTPQANDPKRDRNSGQRSMGHIEANSRAEGQEDSRRRTISFSSEEPYRRWFGMEILDHAENALDLSRLNDVGVLLFNHNTDKVVGKVIRAWVENHRGMAEVEFDTDDDAEKIFGKVKSGTLKTTSVRYRVDSWEEVVAGRASSGRTFYRPLPDRPQMDAAGGVHCFRAGGRHRGRGQSRRPGAGDGQGPFCL